MSNISLLKMVADLGHKGMNGNALFYADLCICCSGTPCSVGCACEQSLTYVCCNTTQFCSFLLVFGVVLLFGFLGLFFFSFWWNFVAGFLLFGFCCLDFWGFYFLWFDLVFL